MQNFYGGLLFNLSITNYHNNIVIKRRLLKDSKWSGGQKSIYHSIEVLHY